MERDSLLYKLRRDAQVVAHHLFSDEAMSRFYYKVVLKQQLDLDAPKTFNEKLQWLKLYYYPKEPLVVQCADKYAVRSFIKKKGYGNTLVPLIGCWKTSDEIDWDALPDQFVLKCNHGCAYNIIVTDKSKLNLEEARKRRMVQVTIKGNGLNKTFESKSECARFMGNLLNIPAEKFRYCLKSNKTYYNFRLQGDF